MLIENRGLAFVRTLIRKRCAPLLGICQCMQVPTVFFSCNSFIPFLLISHFPLETTVPLCFGHFYYQHFLSLVLSFSPLYSKIHVRIFFLMLYILFSIIQNVKILFHNFTANSASMSFPRYLLPFLCSCKSIVLWGNCTGHTPNCSVWGEKNQFPPLPP